MSDETNAKPKARKTAAKVTANDKMKAAAIRAGADEGRVSDLMAEYEVAKQVSDEVAAMVSSITDKQKAAEKRLTDVRAKLNKLGQDPEPEVERQVSLVDANKAYFDNARKESVEKQKAKELITETLGKVMPSRGDRRVQRNLR